MHFAQLRPCQQIVLAKLTIAVIRCGRRDHPLGHRADYSLVAEQLKQRKHMRVHAAESIVEAEHDGLLRQRLIAVGGLEQLVNADDRVAVVLQPHEMRRQMLGGYGVLIAVTAPSDLVAHVVICDADDDGRFSRKLCPRHEEQKRSQYSAHQNRPFSAASPAKTFGTPQRRRTFCARDSSPAAVPAHRSHPS